MTTRLRTVDRLRALYGVVAYMQGVALEHSAAAVHDAEERIEAQQQMEVRASVAGIAALTVGDELEWKMEESQRDFSERDAEWLEGLREERETAMLAAAELYRSGRMQLEQMQSVLKGLRLSAERERAHREQRETDDRFLSRQRWREARERNRER